MKKSVDAVELDPESRLNIRTLAYTAGALFLALVLVFGIVTVVLLATASSRTGDAAVTTEPGERQDLIDSADGLISGALVTAIVIFVLVIILAGMATFLFFRWLYGSMQEMTWQVQQVLRETGPTRQIVRDKQTFGGLATHQRDDQCPARLGGGDRKDSRRTEQ